MVLEKIGQTVRVLFRAAASSDEQYIHPFVSDVINQLCLLTQLLSCHSHFFLYFFLTGSINCLLSVPFPPLSF